MYNRNDKPQSLFRLNPNKKYSFGWSYKAKNNILRIH
jgi:hypothetical protein